MSKIGIRAVAVAAVGAVVMCASPGRAAVSPRDELQLAAATARPAPGVEGVDVSSWQGADVPWSALWRSGVRFSYAKATEGTGYVSPVFARQDEGAKTTGMLTGAYHFARPQASGGAAQARHFLRNGGTWRADGKTLPGVLDIEPNPYAGDSCYGLTPARLVAWVQEFQNTYRKATGRYPVVYTNAQWWDRCTAKDTSVARNSPLWLARYSPAGPGARPAGWKTHLVWQYTDKGVLVGDRNRFNGTEAQLRRHARGAVVT